MRCPYLTHKPQTRVFCTSYFHPYTAVHIHVFKAWSMHLWKTNIREGQGNYVCKPGNKWIQMLWGKNRGKCNCQELNPVARSQSWNPVLCFWAMTAGQLPTPTILYMYYTGGTEWLYKSHSWQYVLSELLYGSTRKVSPSRRTHAEWFSHSKWSDHACCFTLGSEAKIEESEMDGSTYRGLWGLWELVVDRLLWLICRALAAQARGVLGLTPTTAGLFTFHYFHLITSKFIAHSKQEKF